MLARKLGKQAPRHDPRTFRFAHLLDRAALAAPPPACNWDTALPTTLPMWHNDAIGDCTIASLAGMIMRWSSLHGTPVVLTDDDVIATYSAITGYDPADPNTDQGGNMLDVLRYVRAHGIAGHTIGGFCSVNHRDREEVEIAIQVFGGLYVGASLPLTAQRHGAWHGPVDLTGDSAPGSWGGHALSSAKYDHGGLTFITWGGHQVADWPWADAYVDECYGIISEDWVSGKVPAPNGLDIERVRAALASLGGS